jgi:hypothetical protein
MALWWLVLRVVVAPGGEVKEFDPLFGILGATRTWFDGRELFGALSVVLAIGLAAVALHSRGVRSPLGPTIVIQLVFVGLLAADVIGPNYNAPRAAGPLLALSLIALAVPRPDPRPLPSLATEAQVP